MKILRIVGVTIILICGAGLAYNYSKTWTTVRASIPPLGPLGQRVLQDLARESGKESTWLRIRREAADDPGAAARAIENGQADAAIVRSDVAMPRNGRSIAVFQTLYAFLAVPPRSTVEAFKDLRDKVVAIVPEGSANERLLDLVLAQYGVPAGAVRRVQMRPDEVGPAMQQRKISAAFVVSPAGGVSVQTLQSIQKALKGTPSVIGVDGAEAVRRSAAGVDAAEIPKGVLGGSPAQPEEDLSTIAVTLRVVTASQMSNFKASELTRVLYEAKAKALPGNPFVREFEQPDSDEKDYPIHPAAQAYFDGEAPTFMDLFESFFWLGWALVGLLGSLIGWILSKARKPENVMAKHFGNFLSFLEEVHVADLKQLDTLQARVDLAVARLLDMGEKESINTEEMAVYSMAINYTRDVIAERRAQLAGRQAPA